ncbi:MAG TPA: VOC family protein [Steroidobacteraceae bacterium]|nr:VOC family protein [Steroidobacteraceae bacterium]
MPVLGLDHVNVRTPDFKRTVEFLRDALGMTVSPPPSRESIDKGAWVYDHGGAPVLHLASADVAYSPSEVLPAEAPRGSGAIHHIALSCADFAATRARLIALDVSFRENHVADMGIRQIFVRDPTDILLELNFREG